LSRRELSKGPSSLADMTASVLQGKFVMGRHVEAPVVRLGGERERERQYLLCRMENGV
jgi:hypothetical protein